MNKEFKVLLQFYFTFVLIHEVGTRIYVRSTFSNTDTDIHEVIFFLISLVFALSWLKKSINIAFNHDPAIYKGTDLVTNDRRKYTRKNIESVAHIKFNNYSNVTSALIKDYGAGFDSVGLQTVIPLKIFEDILIENTNCPIANRFGMVVRQNYNKKNKCYDIGLKLYNSPSNSLVPLKLFGLVHTFIHKITSLRF